MKPVILIPARMKATRLPGKPLLDIGGKPMIVRVLERAMQANAGEVYVACDGEEIKAAVEKAGGNAVLTDADLPSGSDRIYQALQRIPNGKQYDVVINVQGDLPTLDPTLITAVLAPLANPLVDISTLAAKITDTAEITDPSVVKPVIAFTTPTQGRALYFSRAAVPQGEGAYYHHIGIYAYRRTALERFVALVPSPLELREKLEQLRALEAGMRIEVTVVDTVPLGVDTEIQLERAREFFSY